MFISWLVFLLRLYLHLVHHLHAAWVVFQNDGQSRHGRGVKGRGACKKKTAVDGEDFLLADYTLEKLSNYPLWYGVSQAFMKTV